MRTSAIKPGPAASGPDADVRSEPAGSSGAASRPPGAPSLPFTPRRMVDWFSPVELGRTGIGALLAEVFGAYGDKLEIEGVGQPTPRADVLVLGGDQVYPSATRDNYRDRMAGPYAAALPAVSGHTPVLFAIPGNHDWYDGLTSFTRQFCQRRTIGAWQTEQFRSYFAV